MTEYRERNSEDLKPIRLERGSRCLLLEGNPAESILKIDEVLVDDSEGIRRENKRPVSFLTDESTSASSIPDGGQMGIHGAAE